MASKCKDKLGSLFYYNTQRKATIQSRRIGAIQRIIQVGVFCYIFLYTVIFEKGYQEYDTVVSATSAKVKGTSRTQINKPGESRIWDNPDYVIPPLENNAFFVTTRAVKTARQTPGRCPENRAHKGANCKKDLDCKKGKYVQNGNGMMNGTCDRTLQTCIIEAWCPVESSTDKHISVDSMLYNAINFTVLIKNQIKFPKFGVKRRNIPATFTASYLQKCTYDENHKVNKFCPVFKIGDIIKKTGEDFTKLAKEGGFILINIDWTCDLNKALDKCVPRYNFSRLDDSASVSPGWNFRYANFYTADGKEYRDMVKAYGIRFIIDVTGEGGKFNFAEFGKTVGSGLGYFGISVIICDFLLTKICDDRKERRYHHAIYDTVEDHDKCCTCMSKKDSEEPDAPEEKELNEL